MSNLLSTTEMVTECQSRVPIGLSSPFWGKKLNEAYRWITQKGNFVWEIDTASLDVPAGIATIALPATCNIGKPMWIYGPISSVGGSPTLASDIPFVPNSEAGSYNVSELTMPPGAFSCFTVIQTSVIPGWFIQFYPTSAVPTITSGTMRYSLIFHLDAASMEKPVSDVDYFPTPNCFDSLLIELAEAEARRIYGLAGWEIIQKRAESGIMSLLDPYRSTKNAVAGMADQQKQTGERKLMGQENS